LSPNKERLESTHEYRDQAKDRYSAIHARVLSSFADSPLLVAVDRHGPGHDVAYVTEDPRPFFLVIESENLDWSVEVDEGLPGQKVVSDPKD